MSERTIRFASFKYTDSNGVHRIAFRGQTVDLPGTEVKRGEKLNAFLKDEEELEQNGDLTTLTADSTDEEFVAWIKAATNDEVSSFLSAEPDEGQPSNADLAERILDAEAQAAKDQNRSIRVGVEKAVEAAVAGRST